jgi:hypothetical protein
VTDRVEYPACDPERRSGNEPVVAASGPTGLVLRDFWAWSASDLLSNATRGIFAEYLVAAALGVHGGVRSEWDAFDLLAEGGVRVEVKSAAYLQAWYQRALSKITFGIRATRGWDAATNAFETEPRIQADVYVFCVLHHQDKATVDPLDLRQWTFYVLPTAVLRTRVPGQKSISLAALLALGARKVDHAGIAQAVRTAATSDADGLPVPRPPLNGTE